MTDQEFLDQLRQDLKYDPETGEFTWLRRRGFAGKVAGSIRAIGYRFINYRGKIYRAHRLAWLMVHGRWPREHLDHINGKRSDNRIANLRECNRSQNQQNVTVRADNKSGLLGVSWHTRDSRWIAQIKVGGKTHYLGGFRTKDDAYSAYLAAKSELHIFQPTPREAGAPSPSTTADIEQGEMTR